MVKGKVVVVAPCATVAEPGRVNMPVGLADNVRNMPPAGAGIEMVAVQVVEVEDIKVVLAQTTEDRVIGAVMERARDLEEPLKVAVMEGFWAEVTAAAVAVKVVEEAPTVTVTDGGTVTAEVLLLAIATLEPPAGAGLESVTVQVVEADATRLVLLHCRDVMEMGATSERLAEVRTPFRVAVVVAV